MRVAAVAALVTLLIVWSVALLVLAARSGWMPPTRLGRRLWRPLRRLVRRL